jgi:ABC-type spermidine/putrescine transport system permease subunit II
VRTNVPAVDVRLVDVVKRFGDTVAVDHIDLEVYGSQLRGISVQVNVIGTMILVSAVGLVLLTTLWQRRVAARDYGMAVS